MRSSSKHIRSKMRELSHCCSPPDSSLAAFLPLVLLVLLLAVGVWGWINIFTGFSTPNTATSAVTVQETRDEQILNQFSGFTGIHFNLRRVVMAAMNDPDSFNHVETTYFDDGDSLRVQMRYRGKNAFGGVVLDSVTARVSLEGEVLEILEQ